MISVPRVADSCHLLLHACTPWMFQERFWQQKRKKQNGQFWGWFPQGHTRRFRWTQEMAVLSAERKKGTRCFKAGRAIYIILNIFVYESVLGSFPLINPRRSCAIFLNALSSENPHTGRHVDVWCGPVNRPGERARQSSPGSRPTTGFRSFHPGHQRALGEWQPTCLRSHRDWTLLRISLSGRVSQEVDQLIQESALSLCRAGCCHLFGQRSGVECFLQVLSPHLCIILRLLCFCPLPYSSFFFFFF